VAVKAQDISEDKATMLKSKVRSEFIVVKDGILLLLKRLTGT
jgi:hypothetical protein